MTNFFLYFNTLSGATQFMPDPKFMDHGQSHPEDIDMYSTRSWSSLHRELQDVWSSNNGEKNHVMGNWWIGYKLNQVFPLHLLMYSLTNHISD